jgi:hypothetical protein
MSNTDDEIVIHLVDKEKLIYRFINEKKYIQTIIDWEK